MSERRTYGRILDLTESYVRRGWVKGDTAVDRHGESVRADCRTAVAWCLSGALGRACCSVGRPRVFFAIRRKMLSVVNGALGQVAYVDLAGFNDEKATTLADLV